MRARRVHPITGRLEKQTWFKTLIRCDHFGVRQLPPLVDNGFSNWIGNVPWGTLIRSPSMCAIMCAYFTYVYCLWIFLSWLPSYLVEFRPFTLLKVGLFASLPLWAGVVGDTVGGLATDYLLKRTGSAKIGRPAVAITGLLGCAVFIVPAALTDDAYTAVYCLTASMFFLEMHNRSVLGGADGYRRQIFRHGVGHDEYGRQFRRRHFTDRVRGAGPDRQLAGAVHRRRGSLGGRFGGLGVLARSRQAHFDRVTMF
jgi:Major Facilitator Superfamily